MGDYYDDFHSTGNEHQYGANAHNSYAPPAPRYASPAPRPYSPSYANAQQPQYQSSYPSQPTYPSQQYSHQYPPTQSQYAGSYFEDEEDGEPKTIHDEYALAGEKGLKPSTQSRFGGPTAATASTAALNEPKNWSSYHVDDFQPKKRFCGKWMKICCCVCFIVILIIVGVVVGFLLWARPPNVVFEGVGPHPDGLPQFQASGLLGFNLNIGLKIAVENPNFVGATFSEIKADAFDSVAPNVDLGGGNITNISFDAHSNKTINFPISITYNLANDPGGLILNDISSKCSSQQDLNFNYKLALTLKVLAIPITITLNKSASFACPVSADQLPTGGAGGGGGSKRSLQTHKRSTLDVLHDLQRRHASQRLISL